MTLDELTDTLVQNNFGQYYRGPSDGTTKFLGKKVMVGVGGDDDFFLMAETNPTVRALERLFAAEPMITISRYSRIT